MLFVLELAGIASSTGQIKNNLHTPILSKLMLATKNGVDMMTFGILNMVKYMSKIFVEWDNVFVHSDIILTDLTMYICHLHLLFKSVIYRKTHSVIKFSLLGDFEKKHGGLIQIIL